MIGPILPTTQAGAHELVQHMAADEAFGFLIACFMRRSGPVEVGALKTYIEQTAAELNAARDPQA